MSEGKHTPGPDLKPCPFCGGRAGWATTEGGDDSWEIQCSNDDCCVVLFAGTTARETIASWNTRTMGQVNADLLEALQECADFICKDVPIPEGKTRECRFCGWLLAGRHDSSCLAVRTRAAITAATAPQAGGGE